MKRITLIASVVLCAGLSACTVQSTSPSTVAASVNAVEYRCESGLSILATYPNTDSATIDYQGNLHTLRIAKSASGARYIGQGLEWWTKGSGLGSQGTLSEHHQGGTIGQTLERCVVQEE
ncbi:MliC family protein [Oceanisphaera pacifica]|uniref:MliC family protein n=1 Tax=Oceanisphaera pacifica TaxID=2818389 RepID=A0ABS3NG85_9GAMM|nr:MliC family protein [Oceanisphaera pacifica]MBO1519535.1 MliC family protein [Oceanisphaera pacifica]